MADEAENGLRESLRDGLRTAMKARDKPAVAAMRAALSVIDNAEAADVSAAPPVEAGHIAGGVAGLGAGEVARQQRSDTELVALLRTEVERWESTARDADSLGRTDAAEHLRAEIAALRPFLEEEA